jgi:hypothetical protein
MLMAARDALTDDCMEILYLKIRAITTSGLIGVKSPLCFRALRARPRIFVQIELSEMRALQPSRYRSIPHTQSKGWRMG